VLYPNAHFNSVGEARARAGVDHCLRSAKDFGAPVYGGADVARDTVAGGAIGGAAAGAWAWFGTARKTLATGRLWAPRPVVLPVWSEAPYASVSPHGPSGAS